MAVDWPKISHVLPRQDSNSFIHVQGRLLTAKSRHLGGGSIENATYFAIIFLVSANTLEAVGIGDLAQVVARLA